MKNLIFVIAIALALTACDKPDIKGLNTVPGKMGQLTNEIAETNSAIHKQALLTALTSLDAFENQQLIFPIPTAMMGPCEAFAQVATPLELMKFTYIRLLEIEEVIPTKGLDKDGSPLPLSEAELAQIRLQKNAKLDSLLIIAGFTPDLYDQNHPEDPQYPVVDHMTPIIQKFILGNHRYQETALKFLALRAAFLREIILKGSLNITNDSPLTLNNSGMMEQALKYLLKLDDISKLKFADAVQVHVQEKQHSLVSFDEAQDAVGVKQTASLWQVAAAKAQAGLKAERPLSLAKDSVEVAEQARLAKIIQQNADAWKKTLN